MSGSVIKYGICLQTYAPLRKEPFERSEMISQVLFGESLEILDDEGKWLYVKILYDRYEGWIDIKCVEPSEAPVETELLVFKNSLSLKNLSSGLHSILSIGCSLPKPEGGQITIGEHRFELTDLSKIMEPGDQADFKTVIQEVLGVPYLWGGRSGFGFDCSGLAQYFSRMAGVNLPRDANEQAAFGDTLSFMNEVKMGDLAFFDDTEGMIHHVGIMLGGGKILHASGTVRVDTIDHQGIYNDRLGVYSHKLRVMKRVLR